MKRFVQYVDRLKKPDENHDCPPLRELVDLAKRPESERPKEVLACESCQGIINTLNSRETTRRFDALLRIAREEALRVAPERQASMWTYLRAFFATLQRGWVVTTTVVLIMLLAGGWLSYRREASVSRNRSASVSFAEDKYAKAVESLQALEQQIRDAPEQVASQPNRILEINQKLRLIDTRQLEPDQRGKLADLIVANKKLIARYNSEAARQAQGVSNTPASRSPKMENLQTNGDSEIVVKIYIKLDQIIEGENPDVSNSVLGQRRLEDMRLAFEQFDIKSISAESKTVVVIEDLVPSRPAEQQALIREGLLKIGDDQLEIKVVSAGD